MVKFKEKKTGKIWYIHNIEHIKAFRKNVTRFQEIIEKNKKEVKPSSKGNLPTEEIKNKDE